MFSPKAFTFVFLLVAVAKALPAPTSPCAAVHIIAARASTEPPGEGIIGALVTQVQNQSGQTVSTAAVDYPATLTDYADSSAQGTTATKALLTNQANACPNQKIVLVGYSQVLLVSSSEMNTSFTSKFICIRVRMLLEMQWRAVAEWPGWDLLRPP